MIFFTAQGKNMNNKKLPSINASVCITLQPATLNKGITADDALFNIGTQFLAGAKIAADNQSPPIAVALLAGFAAENILKSTLGKERRGHDLLTIWAEAVAAGLELPAEAPPEITQLDTGHKSPYYIRYAGNYYEPVSLITTPPIVKLLEEIENIKTAALRKRHRQI